jgi:hypothetical protein
MESEEYREEPSPTNLPASSESSLSEDDPVELLRGTIQKLEEIANRLEAQSVENLPLNSLSSFETLLNTTEELAATLGQAKTTSQRPIAKKRVAKQSPQTTQKEDSSSFSWVDRILAAIRLLLPSYLNNALSDWALIGIASAIVVVLSVTSVILISNRTPETSQISQSPAPSTTSPIIPENATPEEPIAEPTIPESNLSEPTIPETIPPESAKSEPDIKISFPSELEAPEQPQTLEILPPPLPVLTPEQSLIASIQEQISTITNRYSEDLILSIQANFINSYLLVKVNDYWYQIDRKQQDKIGNEILENSRLLDFKKLEIIDNQGNLIARNPIVGKEIIILQRTKTIT